MNRIAVSATFIVLVNMLISYVHGMAHDRLGVDLAAWQWTFVMIVIVAAPLVAAALYWTRWRSAGALLLGISMAGSLLFGLYHHFVAISPDHVSHLPVGDAQPLFVATAILLLPAEAIGAVFGFWSYFRLR
jgi:hypothetical protein